MPEHLMLSLDNVSTSHKGTRLTLRFSTPNGPQEFTLPTPAVGPLIVALIQAEAKAKSETRDPSVLYFRPVGHSTVPTATKSLLLRFQLPQSGFLSVDIPMQGAKDLAEQLGKAADLPPPRPPSIQ